MLGQSLPESTLVTVKVSSWVHPSWEPLRAGATLGFTLLVAILGAFSELLGRSGEPPRASWQPLLDSPCWVPSWVHSGSSWDDLRATSNIHLGSHFGIHLVGCHLGCSLGALGAILGATSGILGAGATLGITFTLLGAILGASWEPGSSWGDLGSHLWHFGSHFGIHLVVGAILGAFREGALVF